MMRWNVLKKAMAGSATRMPMAVATSASPTSAIRPAVTLPALSFRA